MTATPPRPAATLRWSGTLLSLPPAAYGLIVSATFLIGGLSEAFNSSWSWNPAQSTWIGWLIILLQVLLIPGALGIWTVISWQRRPHWSDPLAPLALTGLGMIVQLAATPVLVCCGLSGALLGWRWYAARQRP